ncbi:MAG: Lrp/AsnC family transcriptional regulator [Nitrososphaera sp.]
MDVKILKILLSDARLSYRKIAERIGTSPPTVLSRIERLQREMIIKRYSAVLDHEKLGYDLTVIIEVSASKAKITELERQLAKFPNICAVYDITGLTDIILIAKFRNRKELSDFVKNDLNLPYVERTLTHLVMITAKEDFGFVQA